VVPCIVRTHAESESESESESCFIKQDSFLAIVSKFEGRGLTMALFGRMKLSYQGKKLDYLVSMSNLTKGNNFTYDHCIYSHIFPNCLRAVKVYILQI
jgi:hypothetical protein